MENSEEILRRVPPHSKEAEVACLGAMLESTQAADIVVAMLSESDFYDARHRDIYRMVRELRETNAPVDVVSVSEKLDSSGLLGKIGGAAYLASLAENLAAVSNVSYYAKVIMEKSLLRSLLRTSHEIADNVYLSQSDVDAVVQAAEKSIFELTSRRYGNEYLKIKDVVNSTLNHIDQLSKRESEFTGLETRVSALDHYTNGLHGGDLIVLAARPSMGKTAFALWLTKNVAVQKSVLFFSLEMPAEQLAIRLLAAESGLDSRRIRGGKLNTRAEWDQLINAAGSLSSSRLIIDETGNITINEIRSKARRVANQSGLDMIVIDYLQLISTGNNSGPQQNMNAVVAYISRNLKALAKELNVPLVVLSQLSRGVESRTDKRPMMSDLRDSGAIEQDADIVMGLYREDYYLKENSQNPNMVEVLILKHRNGPIGDFLLHFEKETGRFTKVDAHREVISPKSDAFYSDEEF